jgi:hypothetical protein
LEGLTEAINTCFWLHKGIYCGEAYGKTPKFEEIRVDIE